MNILWRARLTLCEGHTSFNAKMDLVKDTVRKNLRALPRWVRKIWMTNFCSKNLSKVDHRASLKQRCHYYSKAFVKSDFKMYAKMTLSAHKMIFLRAGADPEFYRWVGQVSNVGPISALARRTGPHRALAERGGRGLPPLTGGSEGITPRFFLKN